MYAIIVTGGKQYKVEVGSEIMVEKLDNEVGANVNFDVLMMAEGDNVQIGKPVLEGVCAKAEVLEHGKGKKVVVFKYCTQALHGRTTARVNHFCQHPY